ncbi:MAG TPA: RNA methyltransferase [Solirubrobacteraceae bacterium]|nr:RNA methyltransferase [Solirubrobacteraceae bacterium]
MILYGRNPVREALCGRRARGVVQVWATANAAHEPWLAGASTKVCSADELERLCGSSAHQGVCAEVGGYPYVAAHELLAVDSPLIVALDQVQDPRNLGSICRTAECAGATGVVIPERRAAEVTPAACKASAGAVEHIRIARVRNIADFLGDARDAGCWSYGASAPVLASEDSGGRRGGKAAVGASSGVSSATVLYTEPDYSGGVVLVLGSEGSGLRPRVAGVCDQLVSLPLRGRMESLGVAAAAAALVYGILHDREVRLDKAP